MRWSAALIMAACWTGPACSDTREPERPLARAAHAVQDRRFDEALVELAKVEAREGVPERVLWIVADLRLVALAGLGRREDLLDHAAKLAAAREAALDLALIRRTADAWFAADRPLSEITPLLDHADPRYPDQLAQLVVTLQSRSPLDAQQKAEFLDNIMLSGCFDY
jgi:hypothetical protein